MTVTANLETIRARAAQFATQFASASYEMGEAQNFIRGLCDIFGLNHLRAVSFEHRAKKLGGKHGRIDGFFPGLLLIEMKSRGEDLSAAYQQALGYLANLPDAELPQKILVSDFAQLHVYDRISHAEPICIELADLPNQISSLLFLAGYQDVLQKRQEEANTQAAEQMALLHDAMKAAGYGSANGGKDLERYLVRLLFCLFADDTQLFGQNGLFYQYLVQHTRSDGGDLHERLTTLFSVLDKAPANRAPNLPAHLAAFPYVNGALFQGRLEDYYFDEATRKLLINCAELDWSEISPEIFGALFQAIMHYDDEEASAKSKKRRNFGAHYTSETNILRAINPLFMDALRAEFDHINALKSGKKAKLEAFHDKLAKLTIFDPACGCGNFLVVAYRAIRELELEVIAAIHGKTSLHLDIDRIILCKVTQCYGIEIDPAAVQIATLALWLTEHQMNLHVARFGAVYTNLPLIDKAQIVCANALQTDWADVLPPAQCAYIVGNPPFLGKKEQSAAQKEDMQTVFARVNGAGVLDYVAAWYLKAAQYLAHNKTVKTAFVSTNSITQGEQVAILWSELIRLGAQIHFAHRTFKWSNEGRGVAAVHCVIIGFALTAPARCTLFDYSDDIRGEPQVLDAQQINPYLVDAPTVLIARRSKPIGNVPPMVEGITPLDNGILAFNEAEYLAFIAKEPNAQKWFKKCMTGNDYINNQPNYCLWLSDAQPHELKAMPHVMELLKRVRKFREESKSSQKFAKTPWLFRETTIPARYILIPKTSSERREFFPVGFVEDAVTTNSALYIDTASVYHFGLLCSTMHNAWMRATCGRLESRYRYSKDIVYNNFPWPEATDKHKAAIELAAQAVLDARAAFADSSLADLYDPLAMPPALTRAHAQLDKAVDAAYGYKAGHADAPRVAFLFTLYEQITSLLPTQKPKKPRAKAVKQDTIEG